MTSAGIHALLHSALAASFLVVLVAVVTLVSLFNDINSLQSEIKLDIDEFQVSGVFASLPFL